MLIYLLVESSRMDTTLMSVSSIGYSHGKPISLAERVKTGKQVARPCQKVTKSTYQHFQRSLINMLYLVSFNPYKKDYKIK